MKPQGKGATAAGANRGTGGAKGEAKKKHPSARNAGKFKKGGAKGPGGGSKGPGGGSKGPGGGGQQKFTRHLKHKPNMKQRRKMREAREAAGGSPPAAKSQKSSESGGSSRKTGLKKRSFDKMQGGQSGKGTEKNNQVGKFPKKEAPQARSPTAGTPSTNPKVAKLKNLLHKKLGNEPDPETAENNQEQEQQPADAKVQPKKPAVPTISSNWLALSKHLKEEKKAGKKAKKGAADGAANSSTSLPRGKAAGAEPGHIVPEGDLKRFQAPIAMDCEMVGVGEGGKRSVLARVSLVDVNGDVVMDSYVAPKEKVTDLRTFVSGVRFHHLKGAPQFGPIQKKVSEITSGKLLVGHALKNDLAALLLSHPKPLIRDTAKYRPYQSANKKARKLQALAAEFLGLDIQSGEHSSVEDARAALLLYKHSQAAWEKEVARKAAIVNKGKKKAGAGGDD